MNNLRLSFRLFLWCCHITVFCVIVHAQNQNPLSISVESFVAEGVTPLEAIFLLAAQTQVPIGVKCEDSSLLTSTINIDALHGNVASILGQILQSTPSYALNYEKGVLRVYSTRTISPSIMDTFRFKRFKTNDAEPVTLLSAKLWGQFQQSTDANPKGYGGVLRVPEGDHEIASLELVNVDITSVLDAIISSHKSMAWIEWPAPASVVNVPQSRLWNFVYYPSSESSHIAMCCVVIPDDLKDISSTSRAQLASHFVRPPTAP